MRTACERCVSRSVYSLELYQSKPNWEEYSLELQQ